MLPPLCDFSLQPHSVVLELMERVQSRFCGCRGWGGEEGARSQSVCGDKITMLTRTREKRRHDER